MRRPGRLTAIGAGVVLAVAAAHAQDRLAFHGRTDVVLVDVAVRRGSVPVGGLGPGDFRVTDNGVAQVVTSVSREDMPIDVTLLVDTSPSLSALLEDLKRDVRRITALLRPNDRWRLLTFDLEVVDAFGWRSAADRPDVSRVAIGRASPVYDGLMLALLHRPDEGRRHLIVALTDGIDIGSLADSRTVAEVAGRAESVAHIVLMDSGDDGSRGRPGAWAATSADELGLARLADAANRTGGALYRTRSRLFEAIEQALADYRQSYLLRYIASGVPKGGWHDLKVEVPRTEGLELRARRGYFGG